MIRTTIESGVGMLTLARPERRNALTPDMLSALAAEAQRLGALAQAILVTGEGPAFCSGFDLDLCRDDPSGQALRLLLVGLSDAIRALRDQPCPVVMAVHGAAVAGGCALLGGSDVTVAELGTKLGYPVARLGISPAVSAPFLISDLAQGSVRQLQLDPGLITASHAKEIGLVAEVASGVDATVARGREIANRLAANSSEAMRSTRRWVQELAAPPEAAVRSGLVTSLGLIGGIELETMLAQAWTGRTGPRGGS